MLVVERFDRVRTAHGIERLHCIDGCQALGLPVAMKYEWPFGHSRDVRGIRNGASLPRFFSLIDQYAAAPLRERTALLRWAILQVLIGNVDGHAKNLSFFYDAKGLRLAPAYDLVCGVLYEEKDVEDKLAMAIGDGYEIRNLGAYDWARFSISCRLPARLLTQQMTSVAEACAKQLPAVGGQVRAEGGDANTIERISAIVESQIAMLLHTAPAVPRIVREESETER